MDQGHLDVAEGHGVRGSWTSRTCRLVDIWGTRDQLFPLVPGPGRLVDTGVRGLYYTMGQGSLCLETDSTPWDETRSVSWD